MKLQSSSLMETNIPNLQPTAFKIATTAKAFQVLSDSLYTAKEWAIVRELICNAVDAHALVNRRDVPIRVHCPTVLEPWFEIEDQGPGLSPEAIHLLYTTYFASDKIHTNELIGGLGLGSKSPFAYTDQFTVVSRHGGIETTYHMFVDSSGIPSVVRTNSCPCVSTGLKISVPVPSSKTSATFDAFSCAIIRILQFAGYPFDCNIDVKPIDLTINAHQVDDIRLTLDVSGLAFHNGCTVIMGGVSYDCAFKPPDNFSVPYAYYSVILQSTTVITAPIGWLDITANREAIALTERSKQAISDLLVTAYQRIRDDFTARLTADSHTVLDYLWILREYRTRSSSYLINYSCNSDVHQRCKDQFAQFVGQIQKFEPHLRMVNWGLFTSDAIMKYPCSESYLDRGLLAGAFGTPSDPKITLVWISKASMSFTGAMKYYKEQLGTSIPPCLVYKGQNIDALRQILVTFGIPNDKIDVVHLNHSPRSSTTNLSRSESTYKYSCWQIKTTTADSSHTIADILAKNTRDNLIFMTDEEAFGNLKSASFWRWMPYIELIRPITLVHIPVRFTGIVRMLQKQGYQIDPSFNQLVDLLIVNKDSLTVHAARQSVGSTDDPHLLDMYATTFDAYIHQHPKLYPLICLSPSLVQLMEHLRKIFPVYDGLLSPTTLAYCAHIGAVIKEQYLISKSQQRAFTVQQSKYKKLNTQLQKLHQKVLNTYGDWILDIGNYFYRAIHDEKLFSLIRCAFSTKRRSSHEQLVHSN